MSIIQIKDLSKIYNTKDNSLYALKNVSLSIDKGEMVAIIGTSGSGKSTLLNILGCIDSQTSGAYFLDNQSVESKSKKELAEMRNNYLGFVMQDFALVDYYSVKKNVTLPLIYLKNKELRKKRQKDLNGLLEKMHIKKKIGEKVAYLSGGQKQRVAIARALINNPEIILADEPTGSLDQNTSKQIIELLLSLNREGKTIIIVTHDPMIASYCNRVIRIEDGVVSD
ncbi:ABC transporter ATP-binding protein [Lysinibacillus sp. NPDC048646]|uniref:ABC transporter ATP-binding protein n=1 Tax=Lysinibacillus sp. NPDC048646 TaxID=3390574 RepID=UPI003CFCF7AE